jgi:hypothetical protein
MSNLTISQEYLLCVLNEKGKIPAFDTAPNYLFAGGLIDLIYSGSVAIDNETKVQIVAEMKPQYLHLNPLYTFIKDKGQKNCRTCFRPIATKFIKICSIA